MISESEGEGVGVGVWTSHETKKDRNSKEVKHKPKTEKNREDKSS